MIAAILAALVVGCLGIALTRYVLLCAEREHTNRLMAEHWGRAVSVFSRFAMSMQAAAVAFAKMHAEAQAHGFSAREFIGEVPPE